MANQENSQDASGTTKQAEEIVDRFLERMRVLVIRATHDVAKAGARLREEAEDIWAEAQDLANREEHSTN